MSAVIRRAAQCCIAVALGSVLGVGIVRLPVQATMTGAVTPPGFAVRTLVSGLRQPVDMAILPNGGLLIGEKGSGDATNGVARVRLVTAGGLASQPVLEIPVNPRGDTGILGLVIAPDFADTGSFYLWYATNPQSLAWSGATVMRLSRFTFDPATGTAAPNSETIILDGVPWGEIHNGGGMAFDAAGNLLLTTGDIASPLNPAVNPAQDPDSLNGKVLRIHPLPEGGYDVPADNPFVGMDGVRPEIYAMGLRNPFRMTYRAADGEFYLIDVGLDAWEEIDRVEPGANYGWPVREGPCALGEPPRPGGSRCTPPSGNAYVEPLVTYPHGENGAGLAALAFYDGEIWPSAYRHQVYFADYNNSWVARQAITATAQISPTIMVAEAGVIVDMEATDTGIYWLDLLNGTVKQLYFVDADNQPPVPRLTVTPMLGPGPLTVRLSAAGSYDPDDLTLHYEWDYGLGGDVVTMPESEVEHTYADDGEYRVRLRVLDSRGGVSPALEEVVTVYSGEMPSILADNLTEPGREQFYGDDHWRFTAKRDGGVADLDPDRPYQWDLLLAHNEHTHPVLSEVVGASVSFTTPMESHGTGTIHYQVQLTMQTATGLTVPVTRILLPKLIAVQVATWPPDGLVTLNGQTLASGASANVMVGHLYELTAPSTRILGGEVWVFDGWRVTDHAPTVEPPDGEAIAERTAEVMMPAAPATYVATYRDDRPADRMQLPSVSATE